MSDKYILNDKGEPVAEPDLMKWARWFENSQLRVVKQERKFQPYSLGWIIHG